MADLTVRQLDSLRKRARTEGKPVIVNESSGRGTGVLRVRVLPSGNVLFYYRYTDSQRCRDDYPIGMYAADGRGGLTLEQARGRVGELKLLHRSGIRDVRHYLEAKEREEADARRREAAEQTRQQAGTFKALIEAYVNYLRDSGKTSWRDVQSALSRHVVDAFPDLAKRRANSLEPSDLVIIFDRLAEQGRTRALGKVRAHLLAAYNLASRAPFKSTIPTDFRAFAVSINPAAPLPTYSELSKPGDRVLTHSELRALLKALTEINTMAAKALRVGIYLGGQRPAQLLRLAAEDVDHERQTITLRDGKGRRIHARLHLLPLDPVEDLIGECLQANAEAPSLFSSDGNRPLHLSTVSVLVHTISGGAYRLGDIRRTCETELAGLGISKDIRAQLLSHALSGVQDRHYDRHSYLPEKREALTKWRQYLDALQASDAVVSLRSQRRSRNE